MCEYTIECRIKSVNVNFKENKLCLTLAGTGDYLRKVGKNKYNLWFGKEIFGSIQKFVHYEMNEDIKYEARIGQHNASDSNTNGNGVLFEKNYAKLQFFLSLLTSGTLCTITANITYDKNKDLSKAPQEDLDAIKNGSKEVTITITSIKVEA